MNYTMASSAARALTACALALLAAGAGAQVLGSSCRITSGTALDFGSYNMVTATPTDSMTSVQVRCDRVGGPQKISVSMGLGTGSNAVSVSNRRMRRTGAGDYLAYGLYSDVGRSTVWGFTNGLDAATQIVTVPNNNIAFVDFVIYARIPPQQNVPVGDYADSVQVTVSP